MSVVTAAPRRPIGAGSFTAITDAVAVVEVVGAQVRVTFTPDLDAAEEAAVVALMTSANDDDAEARQHLADLRAALDPADLADSLATLTAAVAGALDYLLSH